MSMINDALKRAKQAQDEKPPAVPPLKFQTVEPGQEVSPRSPVVIAGVVLGLAVIVCAGGLLLWLVAHSGGATLQVEARPVKAAAANPGRLVDPPPASLAVGVASGPGTGSNSQPAVVEPPPAPELKLQGIFFNPRNPSAVVNGRTVYVGDKVSGFNVLTITPQAVTMTSATETNVLSLSP
jgi:hypothetical protein